MVNTIRYNIFWNVNKFDRTVWLILRRLIEKAGRARANKRVVQRSHGAHETTAQIDIRVGHYSQSVWWLVRIHWLKRTSPKCKWGLFQIRRLAQTNRKVCRSAHENNKTCTFFKLYNFVFWYLKAHDLNDFQMISDLNTYLTKAIPDTRLTIKKYADAKFEYLVGHFILVSLENKLIQLFDWNQVLLSQSERDGRWGVHLHLARRASVSSRDRKLRIPVSDFLNRKLMSNISL